MGVLIDSFVDAMSDFIAASGEFARPPTNTSIRTSPADKERLSKQAVVQLLPSQAAVDYALRLCERANSMHLLLDLIYRVRHFTLSRL